MLKLARSSNFGRVTVKVRKEVKVGGLHKVLMWDFVQVAVVVIRVLEIRFGNWDLWQSGASAGAWHLGKNVFLRQWRRRVCLGVSHFEAEYARLIMV
ncbi:unnamed protein product [Prunus armeniaca]